MSQMNNTTYSTSASIGANYGTTYGTSATTTGAYVPQYQFHSTSSFSSIVNTAAYNDISDYMFNDRTPSSGPLRTSAFSWTPSDDDYGVGELPDPMPIGEPLILLAFALLFALLRLRRRKAM